MTEPQETTPPPAERLWSRRLSRVRSRARWAGVFAMGIAAALVAVMLYGAMVPGAQPLTQQDVATRISQALASVTPAPALSQRAYQAVQASLVLVVAQVPGGSTTPGLSPLPGSSAGPASSVAPGSSAAPGGNSTPTSTPRPAGVSTADGSMGSGVVVDLSGDILTCLHVVANATSIEVTFADGTKSPATIQATQPENDIAVLRATQPPATLVPAVLGNPRSMQVGSEAYVLGSPFGLTGSISSGIVSALDRSFQLPNNGPLLTGLIQVDAAVNPGSSGGPLVNRAGQVVGIVSALINPTNQGVFIGIGLAVPIDVAGGAAGLPRA
jgi:S1-C subfamily serine protease